MWEHTFICLANKTQSSPQSPMEKGQLIQAGLGGKLLCMFEHCDADELHHELLNTFPKLRAGGGYELLRSSQRNNRNLEVIPPPPSGYSVSYLKGVVGQAKIYIRPLQQSLDTSPIEGEDTVRYACMCGQPIARQAYILHHFTGFLSSRDMSELWQFNPS